MMNSYSPPPNVPWIVRILTIGGPTAMAVAVIVRLLRRETHGVEVGGLICALLVGVGLAFFVFKEVQRQLQTCVSNLGIIIKSWSLRSDFPFVCWVTREFAWHDVAELKRLGYTLEFTTSDRAVHTLNLIFYKDREDVYRFAKEQWAGARR
jgi:hypothetical protein